MKKNDLIIILIILLVSMSNVLKAQEFKASVMNYCDSLLEKTLYSDAISCYTDIKSISSNSLDKLIRKVTNYKQLLAVNYLLEDTALIIYGDFGDDYKEKIQILLKEKILNVEDSLGVENGRIEENDALKTLLKYVNEEPANKFSLVESTIEKVHYVLANSKEIPNETFSMLSRHDVIDFMIANSKGDTTIFNLVISLNEFVQIPNIQNIQDFHTSEKWKEFEKGIIELRKILK